MGVICEALPIHGLNRLLPKSSHNHTMPCIHGLTFLYIQTALSVRSQHWHVCIPVSLDTEPAWRADHKSCVVNKTWWEGEYCGRLLGDSPSDLSLFTVPLWPSYMTQWSNGTQIVSYWQSVHLAIGPAPLSGPKMAAQPQVPLCMAIYTLLCSAFWTRFHKDNRQLLIYCVMSECYEVYFFDIFQELHQWSGLWGSVVQSALCHPLTASPWNNIPAVNTPPSAYQLPTNTQ